MKKTVSALALVALALPLAACGADGDPRSGERTGTAPYAAEVSPRDADSGSPTTITYTYEDTRRSDGSVIPPSTGVIPAPRQGVADRTDDARHSIRVSPWQEPEEWITPLLEAAQ